MHLHDETLAALLPGLPGLAAGLHRRLEPEHALLDLALFRQSQRPPRLLQLLKGHLVVVGGGRGIGITLTCGKRS